MSFVSLGKSVSSVFFEPTGGLRFLSLSSSSSSRCAPVSSFSPSSLSRLKRRFFATSVTPSSSLSSGSAVGESKGTSLLSSLKKNTSSSSSSSSSSRAMLVDNPRPTQYQTEICNQADNVEPGVEKSSTKGLLVLTFLLISVPIVFTRMELNRYYAKYGHLYQTGWSRFHYDEAKNTYLS